MYYLKRFWWWLALLPPTFRDSLTYHQRSRYSRGLLWDIVDFQRLGLGRIFARPTPCIGVPGGARSGNAGYDGNADPTTAGRHEYLSKKGWFSMYSGAHLLIHVLLPVLDSPDVGARLVSLRMLGQEVYEKQHVSADELGVLQRVLDLLCDQPLLKRVPGTGYICPACGEKTVLPRSYRYASVSCERCQHRAPVKRGVDALYLVLPHGEIEDTSGGGDLPTDGPSPSLLVLDDVRAKSAGGRGTLPESAAPPRFYTGRGEARGKLFAAVHDERPGILMVIERGPGGNFERTYLADGSFRDLTSAGSPDRRYDEISLAAARELDLALVEFIESRRYASWNV